MPTPKLFKKFSSRSTESESGPPPDTPADDEKIEFPQPVTAAADGSVPEYSDSLKDAWAAAHKELPQAKGAEKFLNKIGMSISRSSIHIPPPCGDRRCIPSIQR